jgi:hypothetical protein
VHKPFGKVNAFQSVKAVDLRKSVSLRRGADNHIPASQGRHVVRSAMQSASSKYNKDLKMVMIVRANLTPEVRLRHPSPALIGWISIRSRDFPV